jgi:hypothetical protein
MLFGGEVNYIFGIEHTSGCEYEHFPGLHFSLVAFFKIGFEVLGEGKLRLQCNPPTHYAYAIDSVDECFNIRFEEIALS